jgi:hypothetical protein
VDRRALGKYRHVGSQIQRAATCMYSRVTGDVTFTVPKRGSGPRRGLPGSQGLHFYNEGIIAQVVLRNPKDSARNSR